MLWDGFISLGSKISQPHTWWLVFLCYITTAGSVFSLFFPFKIHRCACETVLSPREIFEQDQGLSMDANPRSGIPNPSHQPHAAEIISFHSPNYLRSSISTVASPRLLGCKHLPRWNKRLHWELKVKLIILSLLFLTKCFTQLFAN